MRTTRILVGLAILLLTISSPAAASAPGATTGEASAVADTSATLNGTVNPNRETTTYWFEYGTTAAYGAQTPATSAGSGNAGRSVSASLTGLSPSTTYHFRLVAQNASGTDAGQDKTFTTLGSGGAPPASPAVTLAAASPVITFGQTVVMSGQATGNGSPSAQIALLQSPSPFTAPFAQAVAPAAADAAGHFSFTVAPALTTRYRVEAKTSPPSTSAPVDVAVRPSIAFSVSDSAVRRGRRVRFSGTVAPAHDAAVARLQRRGSTGGFRTVAKLTLRQSRKPGRSRFGKRLRVRRTAAYRVVLPHHADHARGVSRARRIRVR